MTKHFFGLLLFSFIVFSSAFIYGFFYSPITQVQPVFVYENQPEKRKSCRKERFRNVDRDDVNVKVAQAVFNSKTNQMDIDFSVKSNNLSESEIPVQLNFFVKDGTKNRLIATERVLLNSEIFFDDMSNQSMTESYKWLEELKQGENLYVVPKVITPANDLQSELTDFDEVNATSITRLGGRR